VYDDDDDDDADDDDDVCACSECSDLVATCSSEDVRLWNTRKAQELLRISVHNMVCNAVSVMRDGKSIVTGTTVL